MNDKQQEAARLLIGLLADTLGMAWDAVHDATTTDPKKIEANLNVQNLLTTARQFVLDTTPGAMLHHGSTKDCPTPNPNGSCPGHRVQ